MARDSEVIILALLIAQKNNHTNRRSALDDDIDVVPLIPFDWTHWTNNAAFERELAIPFAEFTESAPILFENIGHGAPSWFPW